MYLVSNLFIHAEAYSCTNSWFVLWISKVNSFVVNFLSYNFISMVGDFIRLDCFLRKLERAYDGQFSFHGGTFCWRPIVLGISMDLVDRKHCPMCFKWRS